MPCPPPEPSTLFECRMCGDCCRGYGGTFINEAEMRAIAAYVALDPETFRRTRCQVSGERLVLAQGPDGRCVFWERLCTIHAVKPAMCRAWPFIAAILKDVDNWERMASVCPGMRRGAPPGQVLACVRRELARRRGAGRRCNGSLPGKPIGDGA